MAALAFTLAAGTTSTDKLACGLPLDVNEYCLPNHLPEMMWNITSREGCCRQRQARKARENGEWSLDSLAQRRAWIVFRKFIESFTLLYRNRKSSYMSRDRYKDGQVGCRVHIEMTG